MLSRDGTKPNSKHCLWCAGENDIVRINDNRDFSGSGSVPHCEVLE
ncbi:MAG: hypothetical protein K1X91_01680 [Bacteriodetes bacterium]|nr:hypothetical protein [Bacteroidota bacterium]